MPPPPRNPEDDIEETTSITTIKGLTVGGGQDKGKGGRKLTPYLIVLVGTHVGETFRLGDRELFIGRSPQSNIRFDDDGVSRRHAKVWMLPSGDWVLEDMNSANGTFVNDEKVATRVLRAEDKIHFGPNSLVKFTLHDELEENFQRQMYDAALRDGLTRAFNKKYFLTRLDTELAYARRHRTNLSLVMLDVDFFKRVNDTYGHLAGDAVLVTLAQVVQKTLRAEDVLARYGGEEFAIICRGVSREQAYVLAERIRALVEATGFESNGARLPVTVSLGVAGMPEFAAESSVQLVAAADEALYAAKRGGRNCVMRYG
jgi:two-component system, cell cycle response regulator